MSFICESCGKGMVYGRQSSHGRGVAGKRWKKRAQVTLRTFKPNIQKMGVMVLGKKVTMKLCTNCIKKIKTDGKIRQISRIASL